LRGGKHAPRNTLVMRILVHGEIRFGFPLFYVSDALQNLEVVTRMGLGGDPCHHPPFSPVLTKSAHRDTRAAFVRQRGTPEATR
jgi:hypothetical protein